MNIVLIVSLLLFSLLTSSTAEAKNRPCPKNQAGSAHCKNHHLVCHQGHATCTERHKSALPALNIDIKKSEQSLPFEQPEKAEQAQAEIIKMRQEHARQQQEYEHYLQQSAETLRRANDAEIRRQQRILEEQEAQEAIRRQQLQQAQEQYLRERN